MAELRGFGFGIGGGGGLIKFFFFSRKKSERLERKKKHDNVALLPLPPPSPKAFKKQTIQNSPSVRDDKVPPRGLKPGK